MGYYIDIFYNSIDDIINGSSLLLLVQYLLKIPTIKGIKTGEKFQKNNVLVVIDFLKEQNTVFKLSKFDFDNETNQKSNIISFITLLLQQYFLKGGKTILVEKVGECFGKKFY